MEKAPTTIRNDNDYQEAINNLEGLRAMSHALIDVTNGVEYDYSSIFYLMNNILDDSIEKIKEFHGEI